VLFATNILAHSWTNIPGSLTTPFPLEFSAWPFGFPIWTLYVALLSCPYVSCVRVRSNCVKSWAATSLDRRSSSSSSSSSSAFGPLSNRTQSLGAYRA
jgi:hypothetical protein